MQEESIYIIYVLLFCFIAVYLYGVITYFNLKNTCSKLRNTGAPGQRCVSPKSRTARCWNTGSDLSCSHCVFGYKPDQDGHVCMSNNNIIENNHTCRYASLSVLPEVQINQEGFTTDVAINYASGPDAYVTPKQSVNDQILYLLQENCYYDLEIKSDVAVKTECQNITKNGDGFCRKDYDTFVKVQKIRYRPDKDSSAKLKFTKEN